MKFFLSISFCLLACISYSQNEIVKLYDQKPAGTESWSWTEQEQFNKTWQTQVAVSYTHLDVYKRQL